LDSQVSVKQWEAPQSNPNHFVPSGDLESRSLRTDQIEESHVSVHPKSDLKKPDEMKRAPLSVTHFLSVDILGDSILIEGY
jgi:hypothetical protein